MGKRYQVKVGHEFCKEIHITIGESVADPPARRLQSILIWALVVIASTTVVAATLHGVLTGSYTALHALAEAAAELMRAGARLAKPG